MDNVFINSILNFKKKRNELFKDLNFNKPLQVVVCKRIEELTSYNNECRNYDSLDSIRDYFGEEDDFPIVPFGLPERIILDQSIYNCEAGIDLIYKAYVYSSFELYGVINLNKMITFDKIDKICIDLLKDKDFCDLMLYAHKYEIALPKCSLR